MVRRFPTFSRMASRKGSSLLGPPLGPFGVGSMRPHSCRMRRTVLRSLPTAIAIFRMPRPWRWRLLISPTCSSVKNVGSVGSSSSCGDGSCVFGSWPGDVRVVGSSSVIRFLLGLGTKLLCGGGELVEKSASLSLDPATFRVGKTLGRDLERGEVVEGPANVAELRFETETDSSETDRRPFLGPHDGKGMTKKRLPFLIRSRCPVRRQERQGLRGLQGMRLGGIKKPFLGLFGQSTKGVGESGSQDSTIDLLLKTPIETLGQGLAARNPRRAPAQK